MTFNGHRVLIFRPNALRHRKVADQFVSKASVGFDGFDTQVLLFAVVKGTGGTQTVDADRSAGGQGRTLFARNFALCIKKAPIF